MYVINPTVQNGSYSCDILRMHWSKSQPNCTVQMKRYLIDSETSIEELYNDLHQKLVMPWKPSSTKTFYLEPQRSVSVHNQRTSQQHFPVMHRRWQQIIFHYYKK